jgi:hypothetical protein
MIRNTSRPGVYAKLSTVERWIKQCICEWEVERKSYRELSHKDRLARMAQNIEEAGSLIDNRPKSRKSGYLPPINVCGEREIMPKSEIWTREVKYQCLVQARELASL